MKMQHFKLHLTIEEVLASKPIATPLHRSDCCLVTDGGGAVVITTNEKAKDLNTQTYLYKRLWRK